MSNKRNRRRRRSARPTSTIIPKIGSIRTQPTPRAQTSGGGRGGGGNKPAGVQTEVPSMREVQKYTERFMKGINKQQRKEQKRYLRKLSKQQEGYDFRLEAQDEMLDAQLNSLAEQSAYQQDYYASLLGQITSQQEAELTARREEFAQQNLQSEDAISRLQQDIERLSLISSPPVVNIDTRPGMLGFSQAQQASQSRQRLGMIGTRKAGPQRSSALGLTTAA